MPTEYVPVPVPASLVPAVMTFIAKLMALDKPAPSKPEPSEAEWAEEDLRTLWRRSGRSIRGTLKVVATYPTGASGDVIAREALSKASKGHSVAGTMGSLQRLCNKRFGGRNPITSMYDTDKREWRYFMAKDIGEIIKKLAGE